MIDGKELVKGEENCYNCGCNLKPVCPGYEKPKMKIKEVGKDFGAEVQRQERDFENKVSMERPTRKVREVVVINGKKFFVV